MRALATCALALAACGHEVSAPEAVHGPHAAISEALRPTNTSSSLMWRYGASDVVEAAGTDGGSFLVHFTRAGVNAVPAPDGDDSGVPDFVDEVNHVYAEVGRLYHGPLAFRRPLSDQGLPDNGGDGRFDVYLLDFARAADGAFRVDTCPAAAQCVGYVVQENDFATYGYPSTGVATRILGSHEYFHAVQAAYSNQQGVVVSEGTAVWATEQFDPSTADFEHFIGSYLERVDRSLDTPPPGPVPAFAYGSAIFFQFLSERYEPAIVRKLWEHLEPGMGDPAEPANVADPTWLVQLDALLTREYQSSFAQAFTEFATWNLWLGEAANPTKSYRNGASYPPVPFSEVGLPSAQESLRVYYASTQYFRAPGAGRPSLVAALVDNPATPDDDLQGLALVVATRAAGKNLAVATSSAARSTGLSIDTSGAEHVLIGVINGRRGANGALLSARPSLCLGTAAEVAACKAKLNPGVDAGLPDSVSGAGDAGIIDAGAPVDSGVKQEAGMTPGPPTPGCGCGVVDSATGLLAALGWLLSRRSRA